MVDVVEQHGDEWQPGNGEPGNGMQPSPRAHTSPSQPLDEEQLRQFQQFQQFQDYLKFSEAQQHEGGTLVPRQAQPPVSHQTGLPIPAGPPSGELVPAGPTRPKTPRWVKWLLRKILAWLIAILLLGILLTWAYHHFFPNAANDQGSGIEGGGQTYHSNLILSTQPYEAVRSVYDAVAQNLIPQACGRMREDIQQKFAADLGYGDCQQAVLGLHTQVVKGRVNDYAESIPSYTSNPVPADVFTISSCAFDVQGGPRLGAFTVTKVEKNQWLITGHTSEPTPCPAPTSSAGPTR